MASYNVKHVPLHYKLVSLSGVANGLDCWQCVGDECMLEPDKTTIAEKRQCQREESCLVSQGEGEGEGSVRGKEGDCWQCNAVNHWGQNKENK